MTRYAHYDAESKRVIGFYRQKEKDNDQVPSPNISISDEDWLLCLQQQGQNVIFVAEDLLSLEMKDHWTALTSEKKWDNIKSKAIGLKKSTDAEVIDCYANSVAVNPDLVTYRSDLQAIIDADEMGDPDAVVFPVYP